MKPATRHLAAKPVFSCTRRRWIQLATGVCGSSALQTGAPGKGGPASRHDFSAPLMATTFRIATWSNEPAKLEQPIDEAFNVIARLNTLFSDYEPNSEVSQLSRSGTEGMQVSDDMWRILSQAREMAERTNGAFDFTCGHLSRLWRRAIRRGELPPNDRLHQAMDLTNWQDVDLDENTQTVRLKQSGMLLDLGGIAKGYAADAALKSLQRHGLHSSIVTAGGDLAIGRPPPDQDHWNISLRTQTPNADDGIILVADSGVSTSGDLHQYVEIDGNRYSHIVSPKTGLGLSGGVACTIVGHSTTFTDAMATACCVAGPESTQNWSQLSPRFEARLVQRGAESTREHLTEAFPPLQ